MCVYKLVMNLLLECDFDEQCTTLIVVGSIRVQVDGHVLCIV